jgi:two-component system nitrate/nitrite response regulator NarL
MVDSMMEQGRSLRVILIDDHPLFRAGLAAALESEPDLEVVGEAGDARQARALLAAGDVDLAIVDVLLPEVSGITIVHEIREAAPTCCILGLSSVDEPGLIADMLRAGASGFVLKGQPPADILQAIRQVTGGVRYLPPKVSRDAVDAELASPTSAPLGSLTRREREIFELIIRGHSNADIATRLFISLRTVETHRQRITRKLSARSVHEMQRLGARDGGL